MKELFAIVCVAGLCAIGLTGIKKHPSPTPTPVVVPAANTEEVLDFFATWCGPCKNNAPAIDQIEREGVKITRIDVDQNKEMCSKYSINLMPTYIILINGQETFRTHSPSELRSHLKGK